MDHIHQIIDIVLHLNLYVGQMVEQYHFFTCAILMLIIFAETGLVVAPFLPGDSLLFASGLVFATTNYNIFVIICLFIIAAFLGDNSNYWIGRLIGRRICKRYPKIFKPQYLIATENFYEKYGVMAIVFARFLPLLRTFIPFFAGFSHMLYRRFLLASFASASLWVGLFTLAGYYFGGMPWVQKNFSLVISIIIVVSMLPATYEFVMYHAYKKKRPKKEEKL
jgi:membrane-associated protein